MLQFKKATKEQSRLRMALDGPAGAGKTFTGLKFGFAVLERVGGKLAVIDTEHASAAKYADDFPEFDVVELDTFSPDTYAEAINLAEKSGYSVLLIDSLSHAWAGVEGALEQVDRAAARSSGNSYAAWKDVTPMHQRMVEAILQSGCHIIVTMRSKMEYVLEEREGKNGRTIQVPRKVGMAPVQRQGMEYEFDVVADMDTDHRMIVSKSRCTAVDGAVVLKPDGSWMTPVIDWLVSGKEAVKSEPPVKWQDDLAEVTKFWAWLDGTGRDRAACLTALKADKIEQFTGTAKEAATIITHEVKKA